MGLDIIQEKGICLDKQEFTWRDRLNWLLPSDLSPLKTTLGF